MKLQLFANLKTIIKKDSLESPFVKITSPFPSFLFVSIPLTRFLLCFGRSRGFPLFLINWFFHSSIRSDAGLSDDDISKSHAKKKVSLRNSKKKFLALLIDRVSSARVCMCMSMI